MFFCAHSSLIKFSIFNAADQEKSSCDRPMQWERLLFPTALRDNTVGGLWMAFGFKSHAWESWGAE